MTSAALVFGPGWLGRQFQRRLPDALLSEVDITDAQAVAQTLDEHRPRRVLNCAGRTGRPNVDALEHEPEATYRSNVTGAVVLACACRERRIHLTHLGSGCVYEGDNGGAGFGEEDPPNFHGSLYSRTKALSEAALRDLGALQLRVRLPLSSVPDDRNLLTKLLQFEEVVSVPNSVTILDDLWAPALALIERGETGVWNMVNEGAETHDALLALYRDRVDSTLRFRVVSLEQIARRLRAGRSNCLLSTAKLKAAGLGMPPLELSLPRLVDAYAANLDARRVASR